MSKKTCSPECLPVELPQGHSRPPAVRDEAIVQFHLSGFSFPVHEIEMHFQRLGMEKRSRVVIHLAVCKVLHARDGNEGSINAGPVTLLHSLCLFLFASCPGCSLARV